MPLLAPLAMVSLALAPGPGPTPPHRATAATCGDRSPTVAQVGGVEVIARERDAAALVETAREYLRGLESPPRVCATASFNPARVVRPPPHFAHAPRAWVDARHPQQVLVYIVDPAWERVLVRRLDGAEVLDEVTRDEVGHILRASFEALLAGATLGVVRSEASAALGVDPEPQAPKSPPAAPATPREPWRPSGSAGVGLSARAFGARAALFGPALELTAGAARGPWILSAVAWGEVHAPSRHRGEGVHLVVDGGTARVGLRLAYGPWRRWSLGARVLAGLDLLRERSGPSAAVDGQRRTRALPVLTLGAGPTLHLGRGRHRFMARLLLAIDVAVVAARYVTGDPPQVVFDPWTVRPGGALVLGWGGRAPHGLPRADPGRSP